MNTPGYLARLVQRATQPDTGLRPRVASMFEPTAIAEVAEVVTASDTAGRVRGHTRAASDTSRREPQADHPEAWKPAPSPSSDRESPVTADDFVTAASEDPLSPLPRSLPGMPLTPLPVARADDLAGSLPSRSGEANGPTLVGGDATPRREEEQLGDTTPWEVRSSVGAAGPRGEGSLDPAGPPVGPSLTPVRPIDVGDALPTAVVDGLPSRLPVPPGDGSRGLAGAFPPVADPALPRLQALRTAESQAPKPEITVTIGRIEVLQSAPEPPPPRPAPPTKGATAPDLAQYLRDRSGG